MQTLPLKKLRNFGGKLGAELEKLGCSTAGQVCLLLSSKDCHLIAWGKIFLI